MCLHTTLHQEWNMIKGSSTHLPRILISMKHLLQMASHIGRMLVRFYIWYLSASQLKNKAQNISQIFFYFLCFRHQHDPIRERPLVFSVIYVTLHHKPTQTCIAQFWAMAKNRWSGSAWVICRFWYVLNEQSFIYILLKFGSITRSISSVFLLQFF